MRHKINLHGHTKPYTQLKQDEITEDLSVRDSEWHRD